MKEVIEFLKQNKFGSLATCYNDKPDTRPFELVYYCAKGMFFYTSDNEDLANQLEKNPNICFCATDQNYNYVKVSGAVTFSDDDEDKAKILEESEFAKKMFNQSNLDKMKVFFLASGKYLIHFHDDNKAIIDKF